MSICKLLTIFFGMLVVALLLMFGFLFIGSDEQSCPWISSFLEVCVALNGALIVTRMRKWLSAALLRYARNLIKNGVENPSGDFDEECATIFTVVLNKVLCRLNSRLTKIGYYARVVGPVFAAVSVIVLLVGCEPAYYWLLIMLVSPFVVYYVCAYVCYRCTADHLRELGYDVMLVGARSVNDDDATLAGIQERLSALLNNANSAKPDSLESDKKTANVKRAAMEASTIHD